MSIPDSTFPPDLRAALREFELDQEPVLLPGGSTGNYRSGAWVLKKIRATSLENDHSLELAAWLAGLSAAVAQDGFRLPPPRQTGSGAWITPDGWVAGGFLPGQAAEARDIPACIAGIQAFHRALRGVPAHPAMQHNTTAWGFAHAACWGERPAALQPALAPLAGALYALRQPLETSPWQLIHGDLNPGNLLVAPGLPPAILDFSPFWGPPEFALAIFANFIGPRQRDASVLPLFAGIPGFTQLLVRAALRMLLVVAALDGLRGWEHSEEKWAAECVIAYAQRQT